MVNLFEVKITERKTGNVLSVIEVVGSDKELMEGDIFYKKRAMRNSGYNPSIEKYKVDKFIFVATLIKSLDEPITLRYDTK